MVDRVNQRIASGVTQVGRDLSGGRVRGQAGIAGQAAGARGNSGRPADSVMRNSVGQAGAAALFRAAAGRRLKSADLVGAHDRLEEAVEHISSLIGDRLPALRELIGVGEEAAAAFETERKSVVAFAGGLPVISTDILAEATGYDLAKQRVGGIGSPDRIGAVAGKDAVFAGFRTAALAELARARINREIGSTLPVTMAKLMAELVAVRAEMAARGVKPGNKGKPAKIAFEHQNSQTFFKEYKDPLEVVPSAGVKSYKQGVQLVGRTFFYGDPRGKNGSKAV